MSNYNPWLCTQNETIHVTRVALAVEVISEPCFERRTQKILNWFAIRKKGLSDICVKCCLGSACAIHAG